MALFNRRKDSSGRDYIAIRELLNQAADDVVNIEISGIGTLVSNGTALDLNLQGLNPVVSGEALQLNGNGIGGTGALYNISDNNQWAGAPITLNTNSSIGVDVGVAGALTPSSSSLTVTGDILTQPGAADVL